MTSQRHRQLETHLKRELSRIIRRELSIPGTDLLSVTRVELSSDQKHARVHVSHLEDDEEARRRILGRLIDRVGAIKHYMAEQLDLKYIPELRFEEDTSIREAARLSSIMDELREEREDRGGHGTED